MDESTTIRLLRFTFFAMRRPTKSSSNKLSGDSLRLVSLAQGCVQSSSRLEERAWEHSLDQLLQKLLKASHQASLDSALDHLFKTDLPAYDTLMEAVEANSESCVIEQDGITYDALLIVAPILAWTRFSIASGPINSDMRTTLSAHLQAHLLTPDARLALAPTLYSIDQLPRNHAETHALTQRMALAALKNSPLRAPLLKSKFSILQVHCGLPAENRFARRCGDRGYEVARVGQERRGLRCIGRRARRTVFQRGKCHALGKGICLGMIARQLID